jgi:hypothetical protein
MALRRFHVVAGLIVLTALVVLLAIVRNDQAHLEEPQAKPDRGAKSESNSQWSRVGKFRLPAPVVQRSADPSTEVPDAKAAELSAQFHPPKLSIDQAEKFLAANQRSAASLVAAFRTSGEGSFLAEAMQKFPNDPHVAFEALFKADLPPEERRKWADAIKQGAPDNALGNYLSAQDYFKSGQTDLAVRELEAAFGKTKFNDLTLERMQFNEEAYRASGFSESTSRSAAMFQLPLPLLKEMRALTKNTIELSTSYRQGGDTSSADTAAAIAVKLGEQYRNSGNALLVHQILGMDIEESALKTLQPGAVFGPDGRTAQELLDELAADRAAISALLRETVPLQDRMTPQDWIGYIDRMKLLGEPNAMRWLQTRFRTQ